MNMIKYPLRGTEIKFDLRNENWMVFTSTPEKEEVLMCVLESRDFQICWSLMNLRPLEKSANRSRPKDGRDIPQEIKDKILGQSIKYDMMRVENRGGLQNG